MMRDIHGLPLIVWIIISIILITQGTWLFLDARKRDANYWFWGIWGFIQFPWPSIIYLIVVRRWLRNRNKREKGEI